MTDYESLYIYLFNAVTDAVDLLEQGEFALARSTLIRAQQECEERYINAAEGDKTGDTRTES